MTDTLTLEALAREFSIESEQVRAVLELLDAGFLPPYLARFRRTETGGAPEHLLRRLARRRAEIEELDRRRATILRLLEGAEGVPERVLQAARTTTDRFELEDLYLPYRRPEPEVQLALDRGLGALAERLVEPAPKPAGGGDAASATEAASSPEPASSESPPESATEAPAAPVSRVGDAAGEAAPASTDGDAPPTSDATSGGTASPGADAPADAPADATTDATPTPEAPAAATPDDAPSEPDAAKPADAAPAPAAAKSAKSAPAEPTVDESAVLAGSPDLARVCAEFVRPDRGVHTEREALEGALRILSDRLGRDTRVRGQVRSLLRKHGVLQVRPSAADPGRSKKGKKGKGRKPVDKDLPLRQLQGPKLLSIRRSQRDRAVTTAIDVDAGRVLPKLRAALVRHPREEFAGLLDLVAQRALARRLLPMLEADVRLDLKDRGDEEAERALSQHLRQVLVHPVVGPRTVAGLDVDAKGDWTLAVLDPRGELLGEPVPLAASTLEDVALAEALRTALAEHDVRWIACGNGRASRPAVAKARASIALLGGEAAVMLVDESGLSSYANSEFARRELPDRSVHERMAISLGRRLQDGLAELLKVDRRHLGLGFEQGLLTKAGLKRVLDETVESCVAFVGLDANTAPAHLLKLLPGLDAAAVDKLIAGRPYATREALHESGVLTEAQWKNSAAFLRVLDSDEVLDRTALHPDQYELARELVQATGQPVDQVVGRPGGTKGLRRADFQVDEATGRDLMRELTYPGRDPRPRRFPPKLLAPDTDPATLEAGTVLEGIVSSVSNFGAFVDLGLGKEGLIHISELADRYVRDAREQVAVGQVVRVRLLDANGPRIALSLKGVPDRDRPPRDRRGGGGRGRGGRRGDRKEAWPEPERLVRAARTRRDGPGGDQRGRRKGGPGGGGGFGGGRGKGRPRDDEGDARKYLATERDREPVNNPFASFFKEGGSGSGGEE